MYKMDSLLFFKAVGVNIKLPVRMVGHLSHTWHLQQKRKIHNIINIPSLIRIIDEKTFVFYGTRKVRMN